MKNKDLKLGFNMRTLKGYLSLIFVGRFAGIQLPVEEIALTSNAQIHKLEVVLEELDKRLGLQDSSRIKWNIKRESRSQMGLGNKATSRQMFLSAGNKLETQPTGSVAG